MKKHRTFKTLSSVIEEELKDPEFAFYYNRARAIREIARMVKAGRERAGRTQQELAERANTTQAVIARLESARDRRTPSLDLMDRIARALRARLIIQFEPVAA